MAKEMKRLIVHVYGHEFEVDVPNEKEQLYLLAAEYVNKKINAYMDGAYVYMFHYTHNALNCTIIVIFCEKASQI